MPERPELEYVVSTLPGAPPCAEIPAVEPIIHPTLAGRLSLVQPDEQGRGFVGWRPRAEP